MKKTIIFMLMMGLVTLGACSSNETNIMEDKNASDMSNEQSTQSTQSAKEDNMVEEKVVEQEAAVMAEPMSTQTTSTEAGATDSNTNKISICKNGDQVRTISVVYKEGASSTSCEVTYEKSTGVQSLWNARSDLAYCENKAKEFVTKQEGWGWNCSALE